MRRHGKVHLSIGNAGASFSVIDEGDGPTILVESGAFGNIITKVKVHTNNESLAALGRLFTEASKKNYSEVNSYAARVLQGWPSGIPTLELPVPDENSEKVAVKKADECPTCGVSGCILHRAVAAASAKEG